MPGSGRSGSGAKGLVTSTAAAYDPSAWEGPSIPRGAAAVSRHTQGREYMSLRRLLALCAGLALVAVLFVVPASGSDDSGETATYVVQLVQAPLAGYDGGVSGYAATKPAKGKKLDASSNAGPEVRRVPEFEARSCCRPGRRHDKIYDYTAVFNGFAAKLTEAQAAKLELADGVLVVEKAQNFELDTSSTPAFLGLDQPERRSGTSSAASTRAASAAAPARTSSSATSTAATGPRTPRSPTARSTARTATPTRTRSPASAGSARRARTSRRAPATTR